MAVILQTTFQMPRGPSAYIITHRAAPYICRVGQSKKSALCVFTTEHDARFVAGVMESHYNIHREWPTIDGYSLDVYKMRDPEVLDITEMEVDVLTRTCAKYNLNACVVNEIIANKKNIILKYDLIESHPPNYMLVDTLNEIWNSGE